MKSQTNQHKRKTLLGTLIICGMTSAAMGQLNSTNIEKALNSEGLTEQRARELLGASVPVGGIIPYVGSSPLASNWRVCDGSIVSDAASPFNGKSLPDLRARFLLGATNSAQVGVAGGSTTTAITGVTTTTTGNHSHDMSHNHSLPSNTGFIANDSQSSSALFQAMWGDARANQWGTAHFQTERTTDGWDAEGQHRHALGGSTGGSSASSTSTTGLHGHTVNNFSITNLPPYVQVLYIMRIR